jgi:hypothetical protein
MLVKLIPLIIITIELILIALMIRFDAVGNKRLLASQNWKMQPKCWVTGLADKLQHTYITTGLASERERERESTYANAIMLSRHKMVVGQDFWSHGCCRWMS